MSAQSSAETTRESLLTAAHSEFAAHGIAGARVDRIAERAGVNKERIYGHFGSKEKLFAKVVERSMDRITEVVALPGDDPVDYVARVYDFYRANPDVQRLMMWESLYFRDSALPGEDARLAKWQRKIESLAAGLGVTQSAQVGRLLLTLIGLGAWPWNMTVLARFALGGDSQTPAAADAMREHVVAFARAALAGRE